MNATDLLGNILYRRRDGNTRQDATQKLEVASRDNYREYMLMISTVLVEEGNPMHVRNAAGLALKNALTARDSARQAEYFTRWLTLDAETKNKIKEDSLTSLQVSAGTSPRKSFQPSRLSSCHKVNGPILSSSCLPIGFICESIEPEILSLRSNETLTAVIHGACKEEPSSEVQLAAIHSLFNSLKFVRENSECEGERNYIMQVVCEATQNSNVLSAHSNVSIMTRCNFILNRLFSG
ncbi:hypothetical protein HGRIS_004240 [Hohenbuehelia grisea]|uniref:Importin N-terminal domain-containing protein n=1 Tax=Hohenbuehelia grisea TaxID=104357 RepID=A0ABR3IPA0_9AGAR